MPTKKGKSKPSKAKKASNTMRRTKTAGGANTSKRAGAARKTGASARKTGASARKTSASARSGGRKRAAGKLKRTEAGSVWIGSSPAPIDRPTEERGDRKAGDTGSVRIL